MSKSQLAQHFAKVWSFRDSLLELYHYDPGPAESIPKHSHDEYQFGLSLNFPSCEYFYRGTHYPVPIGSLSVIHPGEMHSTRDVDYRHTPATYRMMFVSPTLMRIAVAEVGGRTSSLPFFPTPIILDPQLSALFLNFHQASESAVSQLEQESLLLSALTQLIQQYADIRTSPKPMGWERPGIQRVREYLEENLTENVTLDQLAQIACLSPHHLNRVFCHQVGLPPHQYQIQLRVAQAKALLAKGLPVQQVVLETGFADRSHLTRHFKRLVHVTPGKYQLQNRKNVQNSAEETP